MASDIKYKVLSSQIAESGDYDCGLCIYLKNKEIGYADEGDPINIRGDFRCDVDNGLVDENQIPVLTDKSFYLGVEDLTELQRIMLWWIHDIDEPTDLELKDEVKE